jgi:hypothetical protein
VSVQVEQGVDWSVLEIEGVLGVVETAALKVTERYGLTLEYDDAYQEGVILLAGRADRVRRQMENGDSGLVHHELYRDLTDLIETEAKHRSKHLSRERLIEDFRE